MTWYSVQDTVEFALQFQMESPIKKGHYSARDRLLHERVLAQVRHWLLLPQRAKIGRRCVFNWSIHSSIHSFVSLVRDEGMDGRMNGQVEYIVRTCEHDILNATELILMQTGTSGPCDKGMKQWSLEVKRSKVKVTQGWKWTWRLGGGIFSTSLDRVA